MESLDLTDIIVTAGPATEPLSTTEAKLHLRVDHSADDTLIASLVKAARQKIEIETSRALVTQSMSLKLDRFPPATAWLAGGERIYSQSIYRAPIEIRRPPVQAITSITYVDTDGVTQTLSTDVYRLIQDEPARVELKYGQSWPSTRTEPHAVTVNFTAGYGGASDVPELAKAAMRLIIGHWYENREEVNIGNITTALPMAAESIISLLKWGAYH